MALWPGVTLDIALRGGWLIVLEVNYRQPLAVCWREDDRLTVLSKVSSTVRWGRNSSTVTPAISHSGHIKVYKPNFVKYSASTWFLQRRIPCFDPCFPPVSLNTCIGATSQSKYPPQGCANNVLHMINTPS